MTAQTLPNVGLVNNWDLGYSGWKDAMDANLLRLDGLTLPNVATRATTAPPGSPVAGDRYLVPRAGASGAWAPYPDQYVAWSGTAWVFVAPQAGWTIYVADEHRWLTWNGSIWNVARMQGEAAMSSRAAAIVSGVLTLDTGLGGAFDVALNANITTLTLSNPVASPDVTRILVRFSQDVTGGRTITLPANVHCLSGTAYVPTPAALAVDLVRLTTFDGGTTWYLESSQVSSGGGTGGSATPIFDGAAADLNFGVCSIPNATLTPIGFDANDYDTSASYIHGGGPITALYVSNDGYYLLTGSALLDTASSGEALICFTHNGSGEFAGSSAPLSATKQIALHTSTVLFLANGDSVALALYQDSGSSLSVINSYNLSRFTIAFLGNAVAR